MPLASGRDGRTCFSAERPITHSLLETPAERQSSWWRALCSSVVLTLQVFLAVFWGVEIFSTFQLFPIITPDESVCDRPPLMTHLRVQLHTYILTVVWILQRELPPVMSLEWASAEQTPAAILVSAAGYSSCYYITHRPRTEPSVVELHCG